MIPVTITRQSAGPWLRFALREGGRKIRSLLLAQGGREKRALEFVRANAEQGNPASVLATLDVFARQEQFLMNVGEVKGEILNEMLKASSVKTALELGAYCGYSAVQIGSVLKEQGGRLISIEKSPELAEIARQVVEFAGLGDVVEFHVGSGSEVIPLLSDQTFDFVFIDHLKSAYLPDLKSLESLGMLADGCHVVADNIAIFISGLGDYLSYVRTSPDYSSRYYPAHMEYVDAIDDGVEVSIYRPLKN